MNGRWRVQPRGARSVGAAWLVLRSPTLEAVQWRGPVLELSDSATRRLGPDILAEQPEIEEMIGRLRRAQSLHVAAALQRQDLVAGIGNMWAAEALWARKLSPWLTVADVSDEELAALLTEAHRLMSAGLTGSRLPRRAYRRAGRPCRRCGTPIRSRGQGDANRTAYWCPSCQAEPESSVTSSA
jgi:endonuclease-8